MNEDPPGSLPILQFVLLLVCLGLSFFFALSETALMSADRLRLQNLAEKGNRAARKLLELRKDPHRLLTTLLLGNNVVNIAAASLATAVAIRLLGERLGIAAATLLTTVIVLIFCEIVPKGIAANRPVLMSERLVDPVRLVSAVLRPAVWFFEVLTTPIVRVVTGKSPARTKVSEDEIRTLVRLGGREGAIDRHESRFIQRVLNMGDIEAQQIMTPLDGVLSIRVDQSVEEAARLCTAEYYSRLPVWQEEEHRIVGLVHLKDAVRVAREQGQSALVERAMLPVRTVQATDKVDDVLQLMQALHAHMMVVNDAEEKTVGVVTIEDVLEEIVGEIRDEHDTEEFGRLRILAPDQAIALGSIGIYEVEDALGIELPQGDYRTLHGFIQSQLGRAAQVGDVVEARECMLTVEAVAKKRITRVKIVRRPPVTSEEVAS